MKLRKKYAVWLLFLCVLLICSLAPSVYAESDVEKELNETIDEQLGGIDWSGLEDYFDGLGEDDNKLFDGSFLKKIKKILGGEMDTTPQAISVFWEMCFSASSTRYCRRCFR